MNNDTNKTPLHSLVAVSAFCAMASVGIAALAFCLRRDISDHGMWAVAAMTAAPSVMGAVIAYFMTTRRLPDGN